MLLRPQTRFGPLMLGVQPRVVGTLSRPASLPALAASAVPSPCDIVEVRLDLLGADTPQWLEQARTVEAQGRPVIVTIRLAGEGGRWSRADEQRLPVFERALQSLTAVDVEYRSPLLARVSALACQQRRPLIISYHDVEKTPPLGELQAVIRRAANYGTVVKIATRAQTEADLATLRELLREQCSSSVCVLAMGPLGPRSRIELPRLGSCFTYGYLDEPVAPGQISAEELRRQLMTPA